MFLRTSSCYDWWFWKLWLWKWCLNVSFRLAILKNNNSKKKPPEEPKELCQAIMTVSKCSCMLLIYLCFPFKVWFCHRSHHHWQHWGRCNPARERVCPLPSQVQGHCIPPIQRRSGGCRGHSGQQGEGCMLKDGYVFPLWYVPKDCQ